MTNPRIAPLLALALSMSAQATSVAPFKVMITTFDPFGGSARNNTQAVAARLARISSALGSNVILEICNLPVVYDQAARRALDCFHRIQPDAVISLGEAACELRIETAASNWDNTPELADNSGQLRSGSEIVAGGAARSGFDFPDQDEFCALSSSETANGLPVEVSISTGAFVCNNLAYHLSQKLDALEVPFTFIHVPNSKCEDSEKDPLKNAQAIALMLNPAITDLRSQGKLLRAHDGKLPILPTDLEQAQAYLSQLTAEHAPACQIRFAQAIVSDYQ